MDSSKIIIPKGTKFFLLRISVLIVQSTPSSDKELSESSNNFFKISFASFSDVLDGRLTSKITELDFVFVIVETLEVRFFLHFCSLSNECVFFKCFIKSKLFGSIPASNIFGINSVTIFSVVASLFFSKLVIISSTTSSIFLNFRSYDFIFPFFLKLMINCPEIKLSGFLFL